MGDFKFKSTAVLGLAVILQYAVQILQATDLEFNNFLDQMSLNDEEANGKDDSMVIFIGLAGTGKTTLLKYLAKDPGLKTYRGRGRRLLYTDEKGAIGTESLSLHPMTTIPNVKFDEETGNMLVDCPGFENKKNATDFSAAFCVKHSIDFSKQIKLVLVEDYNNVLFPNNHMQFLATLKHVAHLFPSAEKLNGSIALVLTKVMDYEFTDAEIAENTKLFINVTLTEYLRAYMQFANKTRAKNENPLLLERVANLSQALLDTNDNVGVFRFPCKENKTCCIETDYERLHQTIFKSLEYVQSGPSLFCTDMAAESENFIKDNLINASMKAVNETFGSVINKELAIFDETYESKGLSKQDKLNLLASQKMDMEAFLSNFRGGNEAMTQTLLKSNKWRKHESELNTLMFDLKNMEYLLHSVKGNFKAVNGDIRDQYMNKVNMHIDMLTFESNTLMHIDKFISSYKFQSALKVMLNYIVPMTNETNAIKIFNALELFGLKQTPEMSLFASTCSDNFLGELQKLVLRGINFRPKYSKVGQSFLIEGRFLVMKDIIDQMPNETEAVYFIASEKIFIDRDLKFKDTHVTMMAPLVEIFNKTQINMTGSPGKPHVLFAPKTEPNKKKFYKGADGADGNPGFSPGNLRIFSGIIVNPENLTINSIGGNGGNAQHGEDGYEGREVDNRVPISEVIDCIKLNDYEGDYTKMSYCITGENSRVIGYDHYYLFLSYKYVATILVYDKFEMPQDGGNGGAGGLAGASGEIKIIPDLGVNLKFESGINGKAGKGGKGGPLQCMERRKKGKCEYYATGTECSWVERVCTKNSLETKNGIDGKNQSHPSNDTLHKFSYHDYTKHHEIDVKFIETLLERRESDEFVISDAQGFMDIYFQANERMSTNKIRLFFEFVASLLKLENNARISKKLFDIYHQQEKTLLKESSNSDFYALKTIILSYMDLIDSTAQKRTIINLKGQLESLKEKSKETGKNLEVYSQVDELNKHITMIRDEINRTKEFTKERVEKKITALEATLSEQFAELIGVVAKVKNDTEGFNVRLFEEAKAISRNYYKRIIISSLHVTAAVVSTMHPFVGASLEIAVSAGEKLIIHKANTSVTPTQLPEAILNMNSVLSDIEIQWASANASRAELMKKVIQRAIDDNYLTAEKRDEAIDFLQKSELLPMPEYLTPGISLLKEIVKELKKNEKGTPVDRMFFDTAQAAITASGDVLKDLTKVRSDAVALKLVNKVIIKNQAALAQLNKYSEYVYTIFSPFLNDMRRGFQKLTTDSENLPQYQLIFKRFDISKMARDCASIIRKFTDGFLGDHSELIEVVNDLEMISNSAITAYSHINDLEYKYQLANLIGTVNLGDCVGTASPDMCKVRLAASNVVNTNNLLKSFNRLEHAFKQAMFPYKMKIHNLVEIDITADTIVLVATFNQHVDAMLQELLNANSAYNEEAENDVRIVGFSSTSKLHAPPFYKWGQNNHGMQIAQLLRGENVTLVADVQDVGVKNAVKFDRIGLSISVPGIDLQPILEYLELEMVHSGESRFRCGNRYYAISGDKISFRYFFDQNLNNESVNSFANKYASSDVHFSPYTAWTLQIQPGVAADAASKLKELEKYADKAELELFGHGTMIIEGAQICKQDLSLDFNIIV